MKSKLVAALILTGILGNDAFANLIVNGGFEAGFDGGYAEISGGSHAISGWTTTQSGVEWFTPAVFGYGGAPEGFAVVDLANYIYSGGGIKQSFATTVGQEYALTFSGGNFLLAGRDGTGIIDVLLNGGLAKSFETASSSSTTIGWQTFGLNFTATGTTTTLEFQNNQDPYQHFAQLDNVIVEAAPSTVPEPGTLGLVGLGMLGLAFSRARRSRK